ncbi:MAG: SDR family NAD(P)-dependent oxidoreductase [Gammaproteobacteria bacterium]
MPRLDNKVILVTGATGGIGLASARLFSNEGAKLVLVDLDQARLDEAVGALGGDVLGIAADVTDAAATAGCFDAAVERFGRLDGVFLNAGIEGAIAPIEDYALEMFDKVMAVNVRGVFLGLQQAVARMKQGGGGSIVITSSLAGLRGSRKLSAYVASKHAVVGLMKAAALECAPAGIRINTINPAPIATRMIEALEQGYAPGAADVVKQKMEKAVPLRRYGQPEEVANLALFLLSDEASYITGNTYPVDGGMSAG